MDAKKCDRCGKYYDDYKGVCRVTENGSIEMQYRVPYNQLKILNTTYNVPDKYFDLCPDCMRGFDKWINMKGE